MEGLIGGRLVGEKLDELREALYNYYGTLNEIAMMAEIGQTSTPKQIDKPEALIYWQQCQALNTNLCSGGLLDQPFIWLMEVAVIREVEISMRPPIKEKSDA